MMQSAFNYSFKVWLTTILLAPALMLAGMAESGHVSKLMLYPVFVALAAVVGLIPLALWTRLTKLLCSKVYSWFSVKASLSLIFIVLTLITLFTLSGFTLNVQSAVLYLPYIAVALLCIWAYPLPKSADKSS